MHYGVSAPQTIPTYAGGNFIFEIRMNLKICIY